MTFGAFRMQMRGVVIRMQFIAAANMMRVMIMIGAGAIMMVVVVLHVSSMV